MAKKRGQSLGGSKGDPRQVAEARLMKESGVIRKDHGGKIRVALVYPNTYSVAMSNLGYQKVYSLLNARNDVVCERAFMPGPEELLHLQSHGKLLSCMESGTPLDHFDIICFSITFEMDYINVLRILKLANIPYRNRSVGAPLIVAGGIAPTLNPAVIAPFADLVFIGEAEVITDPFIEAYKSDGTSPERFVGTPGCFIPTIHGSVVDGSVKIARAWSRDDNPNQTVIHTPDTVFGDMWLVETGKGCGRHCRFCAAGYSYRPTRHYSFENIIAAVDHGLDMTGKVGLVGSAISDHPDAMRIFQHIVDRGGRFSVSSLRMDRLSGEWLELLAKGGNHTITAAPEAGSETLRRKINKDITDDAIIDAITRVACVGPFKIKLYFLVGLPGETDEDVAAIVSLVKSAQVALVEGSRSRGTLGSIEVGVNSLVPKPNTPYEREPFENIKMLKVKLRTVKNGLAKVPNVTVSAGSPRLDYIQALLSMGDGRVAPFLEMAAELDGDSLEALKQFRQSGVDPDQMIYRRRRPDEILPWAMVDHGLREDYLASEMKRSARGITIKECPPPGVQCSRCGVYTGVCVDDET